MVARINVTVTAYEGDDFPEATRYPEWLTGELARTYSDAAIAVDEGLSQRVRVRGLPDAACANMEVEIGASLADEWEVFCTHGYKNYTAPRCAP